MWTILDKLGLLLVNVFSALKFAAYDYDAKLKITKTPRQRLFLWATVIFLTIIVIFSFLLILGSFVRPFLNRK